MCKHFISATFFSLILAAAFLCVCDGKAEEAHKMQKSTKGVNVQFVPGKWNQEDWLLVRSPRWKETSHWIQKEDCIANHIPEDLRPEEMQMGRDRTGETYISMLYKTPFHGKAAFHTRCAFDDRMAPLLVFSKELSDVHHDHLEVVLYDHGINLWHHYFVDGKPSWKLIGFMSMSLKQGVPYDLSAEFIFNAKGAFLVMSCEGQSFGARIDGDWPMDYYAGITACEGRNRFFDFRAQEAPKLTAAAAERFSD